ncbi:MAG: hypothetical protein JXO22_17010 [Phycisphaerae bacterium]|nr:hypothetical protein [Phycisphaerae bacterium]
MAVAVIVPIIWPMEPFEIPSTLAKDAFETVENLPEGSNVLLAFDYDPGSAPELQPMATAWVWHCAKKHHRMYFMALWPLGVNMVQDTVDQVIHKDYPELEEGVDYVNLAFRTGNEGVIKVIVTNLKALFNVDSRGEALTQIPMTKKIVSLRDMNLIISVSAGYPGTKEWIQYAGTPYGIKVVGGCTGVQAPLLYPYYPGQMQGMLGAIKGASEYEHLLSTKYPEYKYGPSYSPDTPKDKLKPRKNFTQGLTRMGPQLIAHCLILVLIVLGNIALYMQRRAREAV